MPRIIGLNYQEIPIGTLAPFAGGDIPSGWLLCDGSAVDRVIYSKLFAAIRTTWGTGNMTSTFNVPDLRGRTLRFLDGTLGLDPDRLTRTAQVAGTFALTGCSTSSISSTVTVPSTANLARGMSVSGTGIPGNGAVFAILSPTTFQLGTTGGVSQNASATNPSVTLNFSNAAIANYVGSNQADMFASHTHVQDQHAHTYGGSLASSGAPGTFFAGNNAHNVDPLTGYTQAVNQNTGGAETRMKNSYVMAIIKYA